MNDRWLVMLVPWLMTLIARPLMPAHHPWKKRPPTLRSWVLGGSEFAYNLGVAILVTFVVDVALVVSLVLS